MWYFFCLQTGKMITIPISAGIAGEVVRTKMLRNVADTSKDRRVELELELERTPGIP